VVVEKPYDVEKIVQKIVDRPVPVTVEKIVERFVDRPVERIVEKYVDRPVPVPVEKIVERFVDRPFEKIVYVDKPYTVEKIIEKIVEKPVIQEKIIERIVDRPVPVIQEKIVEKFVDRPIQIFQERLVIEKSQPVQQRESITKNTTESQVRPVEITEKVNIIEGEKRYVGENVIVDGRRQPGGYGEINFGAQGFRESSVGFRESNATTFKDAIRLQGNDAIRKSGVFGGNAVKLDVVEFGGPRFGGDVKSSQDKLGFPGGFVDIKTSGTFDNVNVRR